MINYKLTKLSYRGFELETTHPIVILDILSSYICQDCMKEARYDMQHEDYIKYFNDSRNVYDKEILDIVDELLSTSCGAEFILEESDKILDK